MTGFPKFAVWSPLIAVYFTQFHVLKKRDLNCIKLANDRVLLRVFVNKVLKFLVA